MPRPDDHVDRPPLIATRPEAWLCFAGDVVVAGGLLAVVLAAVADDGLLFFVGASLALIGDLGRLAFHRLRHRRRPDAFRAFGPTRGEALFDPIYRREPTALFESFIAAIGFLRGLPTTQSLHPRTERWSWRRTSSIRAR